MVYLIIYTKKYVTFRLQIRQSVDEITEQVSDLSKQEFYERINVVCKKYFYHKGIKNVSSATFVDIKKQKRKISKKSLGFFDKTYHLEYDQSDDTPQNRTQILKELSKNI